MKMSKKVYLVWIEDGDSQYFSTYTSIADAVNEHGYGTEVFVATPKSMGLFKESDKAVKLTKKEVKEYLSKE